VGIVLVAGLAVAQTVVPYHPPALQRLPAGKNADTGPSPDRMVSVLDGRLTLAPHELPALGSADAPKLLLVLFDYCCPHCRATHGYLLNGLASHGNELGVLLLPTPLNTKCNPFWEETEPRFEHACELARLALAVWQVDRAAFAVFDLWLFEPEKPRDPADARRRAEQLVPAAALDKALHDPWIDRQIEQNVTAYHNSGAERVPVILSPGMRAIVGRPESEAQLFQLLGKELSLREQAPRSPQTSTTP
jgi:Thioredoxin